MTDRYLVGKAALAAGAPFGRTYPAWYQKAKRPFFWWRPFGIVRAFRLAKLVRSYHTNVVLPVLAARSPA